MPTLIKDALTGLFNSVVNGLTYVKNAILNLPNAFGDMIKGIFIPDDEYINTAFQSFLSELKYKMNVDTEFFESLFQVEQPVTDIKAEYSIYGLGTFNLTFFDSKYFVQGIVFFRPFVRGFIVLMCALYHVKQLIGFFGHDAGVVTGAVKSVSTKEK